MVVSWVWEQGERGNFCSEYGFLVLQDIKVLEICCRICAYSYHYCAEYLKMVEVVNFTLCVFYHNKKERGFG